MRTAEIVTFACGIVVGAAIGAFIEYRYAVKAVMQVREGIAQELAHWTMGPHHVVAPLSIIEKVRHGE